MIDLLAREWVNCNRQHHQHHGVTMPPRQHGIARHVLHWCTAAGCWCASSPRSSASSNDRMCQPDDFGGGYLICFEFACFRLFLPWLRMLWLLVLHWFDFLFSLLNLSLESCTCLCMPFTCVCMGTTGKSLRASHLSNINRHRCQQLIVV